MTPDDLAAIEAENNGAEIPPRYDAVAALVAEVRRLQVENVRLRREGLGREQQWLAEANAERNALHGDLARAKQLVEGYDHAAATLRQQVEMLLGRIERVAAERDEARALAADPVGHLEGSGLVVGEPGTVAVPRALLERTANYLERTHTLLATELRALLRGVR